ncbi:16S rRNA (cytidine(1402)-2'-O)-methyltransferase [Candidatus Magnetaquicoccus inordinatus]|uniref:16S rRNA (cytidine(1402)-2'-O)-methyltransferase n=1 Tax=Candidatus Magnetaquicoccus inordinatus TaxID=2496818 RepID=UPI001D0EA1D8|nr:16S rRNA (cytidine(1402)-2'-O)-methyltransferase [Candidatus Magnetaquicoccus inordinatus]
MTTGKLYIVPTPIGNLEDMTFRALRVLQEVECIVAEDTRHTGILAAHYGIKRPMLSFNDHNSSRRLPELLARLQQGERLALVTDAGTPGISDPGLPLLQAVIAQGIALEVLPGASAVVTALSGSGFSLARFVFEGFLPRKGRQRQERLAALVAEERTVVIYESPLRMAQTLTDLQALGCGERPAVVARELTKHYESWHRGSVSELAELFHSNPHKGEMVLVLRGQEAALPCEEQGRELLGQLLTTNLALGQAARQAARVSGVSRNRLYQMALQKRQAEQHAEEEEEGSARLQSLPESGEDPSLGSESADG